MRSFLIPVLFLVISFVFFEGCKKDALITQETDSNLLARASQSTGFTYYKNNPAIFRSSPQSGHTGYFRVRFNDIALSALTDGGRLPQGGSFPVGSMIVKELHGDSTGTNLIGYAVMEKKPADTSASQAWIWGEYVLAGGGGTRISTKGSICTGCHSIDDRDKVRVFNLFP